MKKIQKKFSELAPSDNTFFLDPHMLHLDHMYLNQLHFGRFLCIPLGPIMLLSFRGPSSLSNHCHMLTVIDKYFVRFSEEAIFVFIITVSVSDSPINHSRPTLRLSVIHSTFKYVFRVTQTSPKSYQNHEETGSGKLRLRKCSLVKK